LVATLLFTFGENWKNWLQGQSQKSLSTLPSMKFVLPIQLLIAIYGGFFGAGMGILMLATLSFLGIKNIHTMNAFKTFLASCINGIAIIPFILAGAIAWQQAILMAIGASLGSYLSVYYVRKIPPTLIRKSIIIIAFSMTIYFFVYN
jgi:uncharacterized membrane protein YfcA